MELPKFLLADNSEYEDAFVLHTEYPRFLINVNTDEVEWFDELDEEEGEELQNQVNNLLEQAYDFFENEIEAYDEEEEEEEEYGV